MRSIGSAGTTLLELLVALTITGLALAGGYSAFSSVADHSARAEAATRDTQRASAVRFALTRWLDNIRLTGEPGGTSFRGLDGVYQALPDDEITFLTSAQTPSGQSEALIRLYVDRDEETAEEGLVAEITDRYGRNSSTLVLVSEAVSFDARYVSTALGGRRWLPSWVSSTMLPNGVEIRIQTAEDRTLHPLLEHPILISIGGVS